MQVLRNIGGINEDTAQTQGFKHGKNQLFAGPGIAKTMINQGVRVYEVAFWVSLPERRSDVLLEARLMSISSAQDPTATEKLARTSRAASCPDFVDVVDNYTLLLHQGLIEGAFEDETEHVSNPDAERVRLL